MVSDLPRPAAPLCIVGDLHGRADLLELMLATISRRDPEHRARRIFVGDLIDRGPESASVLARVHQLCTSDPTHHICLLGNHERMLLNFLDDPIRHAQIWFAAGGDQTLASFGLHLRYGTRDTGAQHRALAKALQVALPVETVSWLKSLALYWQERNLVVCHAGADTEKALDTQTETEFIWGRFANKGARKDGLWVAQGHKIVKEPIAHEGRIFTDTGAWQTGRLNAAWINQTGFEWIEVRKE